MASAGLSLVVFPVPVLDFFGAAGFGFGVGAAGFGFGFGAAGFGFGAEGFGFGAFCATAAGGGGGLSGASTTTGAGAGSEAFSLGALEDAWRKIDPAETTAIPATPANPMRVCSSSDFISFSVFLVPPREATFTVLAVLDATFTVAALFLGAGAGFLLGLGAGFLAGDLALPVPPAFFLSSDFPPSPPSAWLPTPRAATAPTATSTAVLEPSAAAPADAAAFGAAGAGFGFGLGA